MKAKTIIFPWLYILTITSYAQDTSKATQYIAYDGSAVIYTPQELALRLPANLKPVLDYPMRDVSVCLGPDSTYYMTGTTGDPDMWAVTGDIRIWKSKDLVNWTPLITRPRKRSVVWNVDRDGSAWNKKITLRDGAPFRPVWAPEIHYFKGTFWLTYSIPRLGNGILKSTSGKAEGPYVSALTKDAPLTTDIDASLFRDDDGSIYFVAGDGKITPMKSDCSAAAGPSVALKPANAAHVGFEGAYLFKANKRYYLAAAEFVNGAYHCFVASATSVYGPYSYRYLAVPHGGHNVFFRDIAGNWWSTFFGNDQQAPFRDRPAILRVEFGPDGHIRPVVADQQKNFVVTAFGAQGDGKTLNTAFIQHAIDQAAAGGGGKVVVPPGSFVTGTLHLKTGVELHLEKGATLLGSTSRLDYGKANATALIIATGQQQISITGKGEIDGRGREVVKDLFRLLNQGVLQDAQWKIKRPGENNRPRMIALIDCQDVKVKGVTMRNSAGWVQDYVRCNNVIIDSVTVVSTEYWNNDGIDIVNSKNVSITHCNVDAADDAICLKSEGGPGWCENIYVSDCKLRSSASAFKLGTGSRGGFRNIVVRNLEIFDTYRSAIALEAVDGGFLENVDIRQVKATNTGNAVFIRLGHRNTDSAYSCIKNIHIADVQVQVPAHKPDIGYPVEGPTQKYPHNVFPASITGLPGHEVEDVTLENIIVTYEGGGSRDNACFGWDSLQRVTENAAGYPEFSMFGELPCWGLYVRHVKGLTLKNVQLNLQQADYRPACIFDDVTGLKADEVGIPFNEQLPVVIFNNVKAFTGKRWRLPATEDKAIKILPGN
jgi:hypothetical protein